MRSRLLLLALATALLAHMHVSDAATSRAKRATNCGENQFKCKNGDCINNNSVCDGNRDCTDDSDEDQGSCFDVLVPAVTNFIASDVLHPSVTCAIDKYQCPTGECISPQLKCNGKNDCPDGADERLPECQSKSPSCRNDQFQCAPGKCIPSSKVCDRTRDCSDGSDESSTLCGGSIVGNKPCLYPPYIENGKYAVLECESCTPEPGKPIPGDAGTTVILYTCDRGYELKGETINICRNGKWNLNAPTCEQRKCPTLTSESILGTCNYAQSWFTCDYPVLPGTRAEVECKAYYTSTSSPKQTLMCGWDGKWNDVVMKCNPGCGKDRSGNRPLIAHGPVVKGGAFPWHVGIYKHKNDVYTNICGGSLISLKYVLSAAHCFWNNGKSQKNPENLFRVIAGKFNISYTTKDLDQQERGVKNIDIPPFFSGPQTYYRDDIAVLTVDKPFNLAENVRPVCVDWDNTHYIGPDYIGYVAGWGLTENGDPSEELRYANIPIIDRQECLKNTKANYQNYLGNDKICGGYRNGTTVCNGDSGGGLTFVHELNPTGLSSKLYFVQGIVSLSGGATRLGTCNLEDYVAFTAVSAHRNFLAKYKEY